MPSKFRNVFGPRRHGLDASSASSLMMSSLTILLTLCWLLPASAYAGTDWVEFTDETATRLVADAGVGADDDQEKDLISGDVDKDGDMDLIVVRKVPFSNPGGRRNVLFMNEGGVMTDRTATLAADFLDATDDRDVMLVDVDGDTWPDLVTAGTFNEQPRVLMNLGETAGIWQGFDYEASDNRIPAFSPGPQFCALGVGDVTGDNAPDLFFSDYDNNLEDRLLINNGSGFFTDETDTRMTPEMSSSVFGTDAHIVDVNGDTFLDIIKNSASGSSPPPGTQPATSVLYNDGTGNFDFMDDIYTQAPYMIEPADFTRDGRIDLFIVDDGQDRYLINTGNDAQGHAQFSTHTVTGSPGTTFFGGNVKFADLDQDNVLDVMVADVDTDLGGCDRRMVILRGTGAPPSVSYTDPFSGAARPWLLNGVFDIEAFDIDQDGLLDLWIGTCTGTRIFINNSDAVVFSDGFESGNLSAWSLSSP